MTIIPTVVPHQSTVPEILEAAGATGERPLWLTRAGLVTRRVVMLTVAMLAILVLLPAAVAALATVPV